MRFPKAAPILAATLLAAAPTQSPAFSLSDYFGGGSKNQEKTTQQNAAQHTGSSEKSRQIEFLNRVRKADPDRKTIQKAVFNGQNELGIVLAHGVQLDSVSGLAKSLLYQEAKLFPGQDLTIHFYAPSLPPMKVGTAHLNARTRDITYQRAKR